MTLSEWGRKWDIDPRAISELRSIFGATMPDQAMQEVPRSEAAIQNAIKLEASQKGCRLWRNNVGAYKTEEGFIRYGLANESSGMNRVIKSADLIGIRPVLITQEHVGTVIGQFLSREIKKTGWKYIETDREKAQLKWIELITGFGGDACFAQREGTI